MRSSHSSNVADIAALVTAELSVFSAFVAVLQREQSALTIGQTDLLTALADEKVGFAERLAALARDRDSRLGAAGFGEGRAGMAALRAASDIPPKIHAELQTLLELAREARSLNDINAKLLTDRLQHNQQALNVLLNAARQSALYGPDGQTEVGSSGRELGSA